MTKNELFHLLGISDLTALPARVMEILTGEETVRNQIYLELLKLNNHDLSHDWFQPLYESELAERKQKKQDFTPPELSIICSRLTSRHQREPCWGRKDSAGAERTRGKRAFLSRAW